jgi:eukaryotic-like serine/threonine-protein kinase
VNVLDVQPPAVVGGRYTLGELIGRGGAADVYRARDELLGRDVAVKMFVTHGDAVSSSSGSGRYDEAGEAVEVPVDSGEDEAAEVRHRREVLTLAGLSHPGLVTVYDVGDEGGRAYFVMQLIEGDTLARRIRSGPLTISDVVALGAALADALAYVHRRGVVHRDVKPGNVLLDGDGRAHLSDFGIAAVTDAPPVTAAGMVIGTASYLSPEQVRGEAVGAAVDVYALGLVLLECLTGRREYPGNALEAAVARLHRRPVVPPGLPPGLAALLDAMTADDPAARPTAEEVVEALRAVSRDSGMNAATVLSPVLMNAPTTAVSGPTALVAASPAPGLSSSDGTLTEAVAPGAAPPVSPGVPAATGAPADPPPAPRRHRRLLAGVVAAATALLVAGSAVAAYTMLGQESPAPPTSQLVPPPLPAISEAPAPERTTQADERARVTREPRATRTAPTRSRVVEPAPLPTSEAPPPVQSEPPTTTREPRPTTTRPTSEEPPTSTSSRPRSGNDPPVSDGSSAAP